MESAHPPTASFWTFIGAIAPILGKPSVPWRTDDLSPLEVSTGAHFDSMVDIELSTVVHGARPATRACLPRCEALLLYSCTVNMFEVLNLVLISIESLDLNPCLSSCSSMARHLFKDSQYVFQLI